MDFSLLDFMNFYTFLSTFFSFSEFGLWQFMSMESFEHFYWGADFFRQPVCMINEHDLNYDYDQTETQINVLLEFFG